MRALSHPVRLALMEALGEGPLTATQAGELIGEIPTTCSFHLRQLARYGFVEEAGGGRGRARPWRLTRRRRSAPARPEDPDWTRASQALDRVLLDRVRPAAAPLRRRRPHLPRRVVAGSHGPAAPLPPHGGGAGRVRGGLPGAGGRVHRPFRPPGGGGCRPDACWLTAGPGGT
ncbi:winged helix-turn-helix domain-containing protein [Micromonospora kangleipakensis]|uniref:winged helix-turn-helix domain-containing protein n=1 Tax=Micromonospora kangleipakensis TaxID=1077942 RepID=UPI003BF7FF8F